MDDGLKELQRQENMMLQFYVINEVLEKHKYTEIGFLNDLLPALMNLLVMVKTSFEDEEFKIFLSEIPIKHRHVFNLITEMDKKILGEENVNKKEGF